MAVGLRRQLWHLAFPNLDVVEDFLLLDLGDHRANVCGRVIARTDFQCAHSLRELICERFRHALLDKNARRSRARFTFVVEAPFKSVTYRMIDIGIVEHHKRVFSTEFK